MNRWSLLISATFFAAAVTAAEPKPLFQKPTLSATQIAFVYAGDLWIVSRQGGEAQRLTAGAGIETRPYFSPDGKEIAFTGEYDGNVDIYVIPATGGVPRRLTWHPSPDQTMGWTPDGKAILFSSTRNSYSRFNQLFTVSRDGGFPSQLPLPMGAEGCYSPDGTRIAYVPLDHAFSMWKRYRGGRTSPIWIAKLSDSTIEKLPRNNSNDFNPMWVDERIFFLSDRNGAVTLFSYDTRKKTVAQAVNNDGLDFKSASAGPGAIVYEQFGAIQLYDLKSGKSHPIEIHVTADLPEVRPHFVKVASRIRNAGLSPTGTRAVFEARGEILTVPVEKGDIRNLTNTPGVNERSPAWSPMARVWRISRMNPASMRCTSRNKAAWAKYRRSVSALRDRFSLIPRGRPIARKSRTRTSGSICGMSISKTASRYTSSKTLSRALSRFSRRHGLRIASGWHTRGKTAVTCVRSTFIRSPRARATPSPMA